MMKYFLTTTQIAEAYFNLCQTNKNSALCISCTDEQPIQWSEKKWLYLEAKGQLKMTVGASISVVGCRNSERNIAYQ